MATQGRDRLSVVVTADRGAPGLRRCLDSLATQTVARERFEVIVVTHAGDQTALDLLESIRQTDPPGFVLREVRTEEPGRAANLDLGLAAARHDYVAFVDADDRVSRGYVDGLLSVAGAGVIGLGRLATVPARDLGRPDVETDVPESTISWSDRTTSLAECPGVCTSNFGKVLPTWIARLVAFDVDLGAGEDVDFWHRLAVHFPLALTAVASEVHCIYYRTSGADPDGSSTQLSYESAVTQRLRTLAKLEAIGAGARPSLRPLTEHLIRDQVGHVRAYARRHPAAYPRVLQDVADHQFRWFPYDELTSGLGRDLVISYAFLPWNDASALVMAKRIRERGVVVDVVSHSLGSTRSRDRLWKPLVSPYVDEHMLVRGTPTMARAGRVSRFCRLGLKSIAEVEADKGTYHSIYSRAMWPSSHVLAALYKIRHPEVPWTAEFSDPLRLDADGIERHAPIGAFEFLDELRDGLVASGAPVPESDNFWVWFEHLPFALADCLVFTNDHQRTYMLEHLADQSLLSRAEGRTEIRPHPVPSPDLYRAVESDYPIDPAFTNLAYFGVFYATRALGEVLEALRSLDQATRARVRLHIFTSDVSLATRSAKASAAVGRAVAEAGLTDVVIVNPSVPYLECLRLTTMFDCLLISDARTAGIHEVNPYMPSKWSDYAGSGTAVWAIVEEGSVLGTVNSAHRSRQGDVAGARRVIEQLVADTASHEASA